MAKKRRSSGVKLTKSERKAIATVKRVQKKLKAEKAKHENAIKGINAKLREID